MNHYCLALLILICEKLFSRDRLNISGTWISDDLSQACLCLE